MKIILDRCDDDTRREIALNSSCEDNMKAGALIKFLMLVRKICSDTGDKNVFFGSQLTYITKHHLQSTSIVKQMLATHLIDDAIWNNENPCNVSIDNTNGTEALANIHMTKESIATTTTPMSSVYNKIW